jgi:hypothetical protein
MNKIIPRYKLMFRYNINRDTHETYYQFIVNEMIPAMQGLGLHMFRVYHTVFGEHPMRQVEFLAEDLDTIRAALASAAFKRIEGKLNGFITDYTRKIVEFRDGFQI